MRVKLEPIAVFILLAVMGWIVTYCDNPARPHSTVGSWSIVTDYEDYEPASVGATEATDGFGNKGTLAFHCTDTSALLDRFGIYIIWSEDAHFYGGERVFYRHPVTEEAVEIANWAPSTSGDSSFLDLVFLSWIRWELYGFGNTFEVWAEDGALSYGPYGFETSGLNEAMEKAPICARLFDRGS